MVCDFELGCHRGVVVDAFAAFKASLGGLGADLGIGGSFFVKATSRIKLTATV